MSNSPNIFDFAAEDLATFLAKPVSDATYEIVVDAAKVDETPAPASAIPIAAGEIWSNAVDDFILAAYPLLRQVATGGAGGVRLDETLALGPNTNGQDVYFTREDVLYFSNAGAPLADPTIPPPGPAGSFADPNFSGKAAKIGQVNDDPGFWGDIGAAIYTFDAAITGTGSTIHLKFVGGYKSVDPLDPLPFGSCVLEEIWEFDGVSTWTKLEVITASANASRFRFNPVGRSITLQMEGIGSGEPFMVARGTVEFHATGGVFGS